MRLPGVLLRLPGVLLVPPDQVPHLPCEVGVVRGKHRHVLLERTDDFFVVCRLGLLKVMLALTRCG